MTASSQLQTYVGYGLAAAMPATPAVGTAGAYYFQTDTGLLFAWNGSAMVKAGGQPAESLISEVVTAGAQASVTFSSIPATFRDLIVRVRAGPCGTASGTVFTQFQFNGDTGANYDSITYQTGTTSPSGGNFNFEQIAQTSANFGNLVGTSSPANVANYAEATIYDYRGTTFQKAFKSLCCQKLGTSSGDVYTMTGSGFWRSTAAITEIDIILSASGTFANGSVVSLYGSS